MLFIFRVRNYVKKRPSPKYTVEDVERVVNSVKGQRCTYAQASEEYKISISVIFQRIKGRKTAMNCLNAGRCSALTTESENVIEKCLLARSQMGQPCDKDELKDLVCEFVHLNNLETIFKDGRPGDDWYYSFMRQHPSLTFKKPEQLQKLRKDARKPDIIYDFYSKLKEVYTTNNITLFDDEFIFNCESGFLIAPSKLKAIGEKGKTLNRVSGGSGRESISVLACISANGSFLPPFIVFKGGAVQARWTSENAYPGTLYSTSKNNGWMEEPLFFN